MAENQHKNCPVCFSSEKELQQEGIEIQYTGCMHFFCKPCLKQSLNADAYDKCPVCRMKLDPNTFQVIKSKPKPTHKPIPTPSPMPIPSPMSIPSPSNNINYRLINDSVQDTDLERAILNSFTTTRPDNINNYDDDREFAKALEQIFKFESRMKAEKMKKDKYEKMKRLEREKNQAKKREEERIFDENVQLATALSLSQLDTDKKEPGKMKKLFKKIFS